MVVRRNYGSSRIVDFMDFGEYVKTSRSGVVLYKVLFCFANEKENIVSSDKREYFVLLLVTRPLQ